VDVLVLMEVYGAGEEPIAGADGAALSKGVRQRGRLNPLFARSPIEAMDMLPGVLQTGDVVLVQGAGNVSLVSNELRGGRDA